jgi:hypothetical protein
VLVVSEVLLVVGVVLEVLVVVELVEVVVGVVVVLVDGVLVVVALVVVLVLVVCVQSLAASWATRDTPLARLLRRLALTEAGRSATELLRLSLASEAARQLWLSTALEIWSSWLFSVLASPAGSSPELLPQAARMEMAKPSPPERSARGAWRIRDLTLETPAVGFSLALH